MPDAESRSDDGVTAPEAKSPALPTRAVARTLRAKAEPVSAALPLLTLPYLEFSHALMRAHLDVRAMAAANRKLSDAVREVLRRQQDLAWQLAETTLGTVGINPNRGEKSEKSPSEVFDQAAAAVRELGEAMIEAQLGALRTLQSEAEENGHALGKGRGEA
jgi:hypothetical protein